MSGLVEFSKSVGVAKMDDSMKRSVKRGTAAGATAGAGYAGYLAVRHRGLANMIGGKNYARAMGIGAAKGTALGAGIGAAGGYVRGKLSKAESYANRRNPALRPQEFNSRAQNMAVSTASSAGIAGAALLGHKLSRTRNDVIKPNERLVADLRGAYSLSPLDRKQLRRSKAVISPAGRKIVYGRAVRDTGRAIANNKGLTAAVLGLGALEGALYRHKDSKNAAASRAAADRYLQAKKLKRDAAHDYRATRW